MSTLFLLAAAIGGTVVVFQFMLTMIGFGAEAADFDIPDDIPDDVNVDFDGGGDFDTDFDTDVDADLEGDADHAHHSSSNSVFRVLSVRTVTAALAFFGLGGLGAESVGWAPLPTIAFASACGLAALYAVYWLMQSMKKLDHSGTVSIRRAVGQHGTVYTTIPGAQSGTGKIQLNLQNRTVEYLAQTSGDPLKPGAKIVVTDILTPDTVNVESAFEEEGVSHV
ncbi:MAG: hypothetical protein R3C10_12740 [Pirellulales bacterium]